MIQTLQKVIVQKYGGSSLASVEKVQLVAEKILRSAAGGRPVVVVVSAMGNTTSQLIERAREVSLTPPRRELDVLLSSGERMSTALLAMALQEAGHPAISLTGPQSGIMTDALHTDANILEVRPDRISRELAEGKIVIVAGFQGLSPKGEVTTLGRGGSDTTAVALAGALGAERCEIYSDVPGVYTADPRIVDEPIHLQQVDSRLMREYALHGARVLHPDCIELARQHSVAIHAGSTFGDDQFTQIRCDADLAFSHLGIDRRGVVGVTSRKSRVHLRSQGQDMATMESALDCLQGHAGLLRQSRDTNEDWLVDIEDLPDPERLCAHLHESLLGLAHVTEELASVSIVSQPEISSDWLHSVESVLADAGVTPNSLYLRPHSVTCALDRSNREAAVRALHASFIEDSLVLRA